MSHTRCNITLKTWKVSMGLSDLSVLLKLEAAWPSDLAHCRCYLAGAGPSASN